MDAVAPFNPKAKVVWVMVDRKGAGVLRKFASPAFFSFHAVNAWEEPSRNDCRQTVDVVYELVTFKNLDILLRFDYDNLVSDGQGVKSFLQERREGTASTLQQYKFADVPIHVKSKSFSSGLSKAELIMTVDAHKSGDLPRINPKFAQRPHRYVWTMLDRGKSSFVDAIGKTDTKDGPCIV